MEKGKYYYIAAAVIVFIIPFFLGRLLPGNMPELVTAALFIILILLGIYFGLCAFALWDYEKSLYKGVQNWGGDQKSGVMAEYRKRAHPLYTARELYKEGREWLEEFRGRRNNSNRE